MQHDERSLRTRIWNKLSLLLGKVVTPQKNGNGHG